LLLPLRLQLRHYPPGVDRVDETQRLRNLAAIFCLFGMSFRGVCMALSVFWVRLGHIKVWRDIHEQGDLLEMGRHWQEVRIMGSDEAYPLMAGKKQPTVVAVRLGDGRWLPITQVDETNPQAIRRFLEPLIKRLGVSLLVTAHLAITRQVG
jgi:hypothetical protein